MTVADKKALESIKHLWKTDDPEWVQQRKDEWKVLRSTIYSDESREDQKECAKYYVFGERNFRVYIPGSNIYELTPHATPEEAKEVFYCGLIDYMNKKRILSFGNALGLYSTLVGIPWAKVYGKNILRGILGSSYRKIEVSDRNSKVVRIVSPDPTRGVLQYLHSASRFLESEREYDPVIDYYEYFLSLFSYADDLEARQGIEDAEYFEILFEVAEERVENPDDSELFKFAERILEDRDKMLEFWSETV